MFSLNQLAKLTISIFLSIGVFVLLFYVMEGEIGKKAQLVYEKRSMLAALERREDNFLELKSDQAVLEKNLPILKKALPGEKDIDGVINNLENLAIQTDNDQILNFEPLAGAESAGALKSVKFSAILSGNISSFSQYMKKLQSLPYFIEIVSVNISNDKGFSNNGSRLNLTAKLYYKK